MFVRNVHSSHMCIAQDHLTVRGMRYFLIFSFLHLLSKDIIQGFHSTWKTLKTWKNDGNLSSHGSIMDLLRKYNGK